MKRFSVKSKLTLLLTALAAVVAILIFSLLLFISSSVSVSSSMAALSDTARKNASLISMENGKLAFDDSFSFYHHGITTLIYSKSKALVAGQPPVNFSFSDDFQNGTVRTVPSDDTSYLVADIYLPFGWDDGVWIRALSEAPDNGRIAADITFVFFIIFPVFLLLAALGSYLIVKLSFRPLDKISRTVSAINEAKDLSGRIGLKGNDEFSRLSDAFDGMFERLERSFDAEKQFTSDASHELRTPLAVIKSACEYAEKFDETAEERRETIEMIHRQANKMSELINQLLNITRLDQGTEKLSIADVELGSLVHSLCCEQGYDINRLHIQAQKGVFVSGDSMLLSRLIKNLVDNGFKYGKESSCVWITVYKNEDEALISVRDDGIGIADEYKEKIWQRFYQVDASRGEDSGIGLGLFMVQQIARAHGGYVTLDSTLGIGSEFILHLPLRK